MLKIINKNSFLVGVIIFFFIFGWITVSAITNTYNKKHVYTIEQVHYSEKNCNIDTHYIDGIHYHDITNCTNSTHNHSGHHNGKRHH